MLVENKEYYARGDECLAAIEHEIEQQPTSYAKVAECVKKLRIEENIYVGLSKEEAEITLNELTRAYYIVAMIGMYGLNHLIMPYILRRYEVKV